MAMSNGLEVQAEPPEELLEPPEDTEEDSDWLVVARNRRVKKGWDSLAKKYPENLQRCYEDLSTQPMQRRRGRIFPLKGKKYKGAWEYELTGGARIFYVPDEAEKKVVVYYAGEHIQPAPMP